MLPLLKCYTGFNCLTLFFSFISLLERAEEELDCEYVFVFFPKSIQKSLLANIGKTYRFFGFELLSPTAPLIPAHCNELYLFMAYKLDE